MTLIIKIPEMVDTFYIWLTVIVCQSYVAIKNSIYLYYDCVCMLRLFYDLYIDI